MIGIFDSGSGGLTFLTEVKKKYPHFSYLYFADYEHCPFGEKSPEEIQNLTIAGVQKLFNAGAEIVILACNTASAWTLRKLQTEVFPDKKILGVTIPGAEKVIELGLKSVAVFATEQTVLSRTYAERVRILDPQTIVDEIAFPGNLVRDIEKLLPVQRCHTESDFESITSLYNNGWNCDSDDWGSLTEKYFSQFTLNKYEGIILGCTHYSYLSQPLKRLFPDSIIIDPSEESSLKLMNYLESHSNVLQKIETTGIIKFL